MTLGQSIFENINLLGLFQDRDKDTALAFHLDYFVPMYPNMSPFPGFLSERRNISAY